MTQSQPQGQGRLWPNQPDNISGEGRPGRLDPRTRGEESDPVRMVRYQVKKKIVSFTLLTMSVTESMRLPPSRPNTNQFPISPVI